MDKVQATDEQISDTEKQEARVIKETTGVPRKHEDPAGNDDAEYLGKAVEKEVAAQAYQVKPEKEGYT
jgi:hypothetical protein